MNLQILAFFLFLLLLSLSPIIISHQLYNKSGNKFYLLFLYYDALAKVFFLMNFFGRYLVDHFLSTTSTSAHSRIVVGLILNFIAYPFLAVSTYFFISFINGLSQKKLPRFFTGLYILLQSIAMISFAVLIKRVIDYKIGQLHIIVKDIRIIMYHIMYFLFFLLAIILLFAHARKTKDSKKKTGLHILGFYYLIIYSALIFYLTIGQNYFHIASYMLYIFLISFNIPVALYLKFHLSKLFQRPSIQSVKGVQEYFNHFGISKREAEIITMICQGKTNKEISDILFLSLQTIKNSIYNIYKKTGVNSRAGLINTFYQEHNIG